MEWLFGIEVLVGMFLLRLALPIALMVLLTYMLHQLDNKLQAQASRA
jgi:hypothetical protein